MSFVLSLSLAATKKLARETRFSLTLIAASAVHTLDMVDMVPLGLPTVRATWAHISSRLEDQPALRDHVRGSITTIEGVHDEVIEDMVARHVSCRTCRSAWAPHRTLGAGSVSLERISQYHRA